MNWMVYFIGGSRDLQKCAMEHPRPAFECPMLVRMPSFPSETMVETAASYRTEHYIFRPLREGLGVYVLEEVK